jgi:hypothetical protein
VNSSAALTALVPPEFVTVTSTVPEPAGAVAVMLVSLFTVKVAGALPKSTALALVNAVPVTTT